MSAKREQPPWSTLTLIASEGPTTAAAQGLLEHQLESLGALLLEDDAVTGVEYRDARTFEVAERPSLVVYTTPQALDRLEQRSREVSPLLGLPPLHTRRYTTNDDSWRDSWKEFFKPLRPGSGRFLVRPSWIERRDDDPELEIILDPGRAFGTGQHESTSLCLEFIASLDTSLQVKPRRVLDLGCGSGLLGLAAARLWSGCEIVAVDVDPEAVETTKENAAHNGLERRVQAFRGAAEDIDDTFDLVLANIRPSVLIPNAREIAGASSKTLILSGILDEEFENVLAAYRPLDLIEALPAKSATGWTAACLERP